MPQAESTEPRKSTSFGGRYSRPPFRKIALQVSSVSPRTRATKSLVSSRAPGAEPEGGVALCVGAEGASPPCSETRTSRGLRPRNQLIASTAISPTPPSLNPPPRPPTETDSRSSTLLLPRMPPQRISPPFCFDPAKPCKARAHFTRFPQSPPGGDWLLGWRYAEAQRGPSHVPPHRRRSARAARPSGWSVLEEQGPGRLDDSQGRARRKRGSARLCYARVQGGDRHRAARALHPAHTCQTGGRQGGRGLGLRGRCGRCRDP